MDFLERVFADETGDDLVEYALLGAVVGFSGLLAMNALTAAVNAVFTSWEDATSALWYPQPPAS